MAKKKVKRDCIMFTGASSHDVTGSQYYIRFADKQILLECGLHQSSSNSYLDSHRINAAKFKFKPSEIDYIFVAHPHIDHCGLIPRLVREGFHGTIITTAKSAAVMRPLLENSCFIVQEEARILSKRYKREYMPLYCMDDVYATLNLIRVYDDYNVQNMVDDTISFRWLRNSHCIGAAQLQLILTDGHKTKKILYTSDIGSLKSRNHFVEDTEIPADFSDVTIMESTYGLTAKNTDANREYDLQHLRSTIEDAIGRGGCIILPCFSFSRTQELLITLFDLFGKDDSFNIPIVVDSLLSVDICRLYSRILDGECLAVWNQVINWENLQLITDKADSQICLADDKPKIILSSSGFCTNGRVVNYLKKYLRDRNSTIVFSGFVGDNPSYLSYRIKNYGGQKYISINKVRIPNRAGCITLSSFSSHANQADLLQYGSSLNTNKLILVHGSEESKKCLAGKLGIAISKNNRSYRVLCSTKDMIVLL